MRQAVGTLNWPCPSIKGLSSPPPHGQHQSPPARSVRPECSCSAAEGVEGQEPAGDRLSGFWARLPEPLRKPGVGIALTRVVALAPAGGRRARQFPAEMSQGHFHALRADMSTGRSAGIGYMTEVPFDLAGSCRRDSLSARRMAFRRSSPSFPAWLPDARDTRVGLDLDEHPAGA